MIEPKQAPVRPRVRLQPSGEVALLEDVVAEHLAKGDVRAILVTGGAGTGKTTALQHLAARFAGDENLFLIDSYCPIQSSADALSGLILIRAAEHSPQSEFLECRLIGWRRDEWIEYLLSVHHNRCKSVMQRLQADMNCDELELHPVLWRPVLDELAADDDLKSVKNALLRVIEKIFPNRVERLSIGWRWFVTITTAMQPEASQHDAYQSAKASMSPEQLRLAKPAVLSLLAAEAVANDLVESDPRQSLLRLWPKGLISEVARRIADNTAVQNKLRQLISFRHRDCHAQVVSLLHACNIGFRPETSRLFGLRTGWLKLTDACLDNADWPGIYLARCDLEGASFAGANLSKARLYGANARRAMFNHANLSQASLSRLDGYSASFVGANLSAVSGRKVSFERANLSFADLSDAHLVWSDFRGANLSEAILRRARLTESKLFDAVLDGADFTDADLERAFLIGADLTVANFTNTRFVKANLMACHLENMELDAPNFAEANLANALLTGSVMPRANFSGANLQEAGLADIDWGFANLRHANLRGVSFHMGSTRSGLVGSTIPMLGSRTGFYTDDYNEQDFKAPEEIRKANLRGADLLGADITDTDFYLVDLRDALYDQVQREHFQKCGAILETKMRDD